MSHSLKGAAPEDAGLASGLFNTTQQVGGVFGLAVLVTLAASRTEGLLADGQSTAFALIGGYHLAFAVGAGFVVDGIALALILLRPERGGARDEERA